MTTARFLVDAQLPPSLAELVRAHGHDAVHVIEIGPPDATDRALWEYATTHELAIVTKDEDFADMVALSDAGPTVVWVRIGNTRRAALLEWFGPLVDEIAALIVDGQRLIELR